LDIDGISDILLRTLVQVIAYSCDRDLRVLVAEKSSFESAGRATISQDAASLRSDIRSS